jgi:hypothetical protein
MSDILDLLVDLHRQATEERSHYYTGSVIRAAHAEIASLRLRLADAEERHYRYVKGVGELADRAARVSEIIAYCAQEAHDGEPYDTINAIATGEYSTRGGGKE